MEHSGTASYLAYGNLGKLLIFSEPVSSLYGGNKTHRRGSSRDLKRDDLKAISTVISSWRLPPKILLSSSS